MNSNNLGFNFSFFGIFVTSDKNQFNRDSDNDSLLDGFRKSEKHALETLYANTYGNVEGYVLKNSGRSDDAKDIFQEAVLSAWLNVQEGTFTPVNGATLEGYVFRIAKYKWLDRLKSKAFRSTVRMENNEFSVSDGGSDEFGAELAGMKETDEKIEELKRIFALLDGKCAEILTGFYYEKKSLQEIGRGLGHDAATIKTFKYRCMRKLKALKNKF